MGTKNAYRNAISMSAEILDGHQMNCHLTVCLQSLIPGGNDEQLWTAFSEASFMAMEELPTNALHRSGAPRKD